MTQRKRHKVIKGIGIAAVIIALVLGGCYMYVTTHPQSIIGLIQKKMYQKGSPNSYQPIYKPGKGIKKNGQYKINDIAYGSSYPNSFLDITYPNTDTKADRPTLFYFHGGGFFGGSKNMGDPLASSDATALIDDLCAQGYNIVNVDYALVPDYHFPVPLIQMNEAINFIAKHKEYHINMDKVIIMGSSAGAIMAAQYGTVISNPDYAKLLSIKPAIDVKQVSAVVVDDAPIDYQHMNLLCKMLVGNYVKGSIYLNKEERNRYECIPHMTKNYPSAFLLGSEYREDMNEMAKKLKTVGAEATLVDPYAQNGVKQPHCFVAQERGNPVAAKAFKKLTAFLKEKTR